MRISQLVLEKISTIQKGTPFTSRDFIALGAGHNIAKVLQQLAKAGKIKRVLRGVYFCPKFSQYVGEVPAASSEVIKTISRDEVLQVQGAEAARQLGLSTQCPVREVFLTNGRSRKVMIGKMVVTFRHVSPKKLLLTGTQAGVAVIALWYLGKEESNLKTIEQIEKVIFPEEFEKLLHSRKYMPVWMATLLTQYEERTKRFSSAETK